MGCPYKSTTCSFQQRVVHLAGCELFAQVIDSPFSFSEIVVLPRHASHRLIQHCHVQDKRPIGIGNITTESNSNFTIPSIDLTGIHDDPILRDAVVGKVRYACEKWGFFQVTNHGIPTQVLDEMIKGTGRFHEQDAKVRKEYYTRDMSLKVGEEE